VGALIFLWKQVSRKSYKEIISLIFSALGVLTLFGGFVYVMLIEKQEILMVAIIFGLIFSSLELVCDDRDKFKPTTKNYYFVLMLAGPLVMVLVYLVKIYWFHSFGFWSRKELIIACVIYVLLSWVIKTFYKRNNAQTD
jgi:hypothetical protein